MAFAIIMTAISVGPGGHGESLEGVTIDSGKCGDDASWTLDSGDDGTVLTISRKGDIYVWPTNPWTNIQSEWKAIIEYVIESIGEHTFLNCSTLTEIVIPDTVGDIKEGAFEGCSSLTEITLPNGIWGLRNPFSESGLTEITFNSIPQSSMIELGSLEFYEKDGTGPLTKYDQLGNSTFRLDPASGNFIKMPRHSVEYVSNGGIGSVPVQSDVAEGSKFIVQDYTGSMTGFEFGGWSWNGTVYQAGEYAVMGDSNMVLTAVWKKETTIAFYPNGGNWSEPRIEHLLSGESIDLSTIAPPTRESYTFTEWSCNGKAYSADAVIQVTSDMTFTAQWKSNSGSDSSAPLPIFPIEGQETIEVLVDEDKDSGDGKDVRTILLIAVVAAIIAELAVLSISRRG